MYTIICVVVILFVTLSLSEAFYQSSNVRIQSRSSIRMADVEVIFPNNKKVVVASGSPLKEAAKKAGFKPNYGCEEGKCGSCELKISGKKIRPCTGKVPSSNCKLENP